MCVVEQAAQVCFIEMNALEEYDHDLDWNLLPDRFFDEDSIPGAYS